ncbi:MAG: chromate transporter [Caldisericia bacterium]
MNKFKLFFTFLKISTLTLGGGYAMVPIIEREIVKKNIFKEDDFYILFSKAQSAPGPIAINTAFMVGTKLGGIFLGLYYVLAVFIPPFILISLIVSIIKKYADLFYIKFFLEGIRIGISVILINFLLGIIKNFKISEFIFLLVGFILIYFFKFHSIYVLLIITFSYLIFLFKTKDVN